MTTHHIHTSIDGLLRLSNEELGSMFETNGADVRTELLHRKKDGHLYIGSDKCKNFDPVKGCPGHPVEESPLYNAAKRQLTEGYDIEFYLEILFTFPQNTWFHPTNGDEKTYNSAFSICEQLYQARLICARFIPLWVNGSYRGNSIAFFYDKDMNYKTNA